MTPLPPSRLAPWLKLIRPYTLTASLSPVLVAVAYAVRMGRVNWLDSLLCAIVAVSAQIASNIVNEYFDYVNGSDSAESLGPNHPLSLGWLSKRQVLSALAVSLFATAAAGLLLAWLHGVAYLLVGLAVGLGLFAYSAGPWPLAKHGLGDLAVFVFYGLVPTFFTYYIQSACSDRYIWMLSVAMGLISVCILVVNNFRDYEEDRARKKRTTIVIVGRSFGPFLYVVCGVVAVALLAPFYSLLGLFALLPFVMFFADNFRLLLSCKGRELNRVLARTGVMVLLYALMASALILLS